MKNRRNPEDSADFCAHLQERLSGPGPGLFRYFRGSMQYAALKAAENLLWLS